MIRIAIKWLALTAAIMITSYLIDGIIFNGIASAFLAAAVLGILNVFLETDCINFNSSCKYSKSRPFYIRNKCFYADL